MWAISQALQTKAQVTFNLLTVILFSENLICPLYSTISVIYVIEDAVFFDKRIR